MGNKVDTIKKTGDAILTEEKIASIMENTSFKREEIIKWHEGFIKDCPKVNIYFKFDFRYFIHKYLSLFFKGTIK